MDRNRCQQEQLWWPSTERSFGRQGLGDILGYARVSTGDQDVAGQTLRLSVPFPKSERPIAFARQLLKKRATAPKRIGLACRPLRGG